MKIAIKGVLLLLFMLSGMRAHSEGKNQGVDPALAWYQGNDIDIRVTDNKGTDCGWNIKSYESKDIIVDQEAGCNGRANSAVIGVIASSYMITKGLSLSEGYEIDVADVPALAIRLLLQLLSSTLKNGPESVGNNQNISFAEPSKPIKISTPSASGEIPAPWTVSGHVSRNPDGSILYKLLLSVSKLQGYENKISGSWIVNPDLKTLDDGMNLSEWKIYKIGPYQRMIRGGGIVFDYGAREIPEKFPTLGEFKVWLSKQAPNNSFKADGPDGPRP